MMTVSTAHLKKETVSYLKAICNDIINFNVWNPVAYKKDEYGFFIYTEPDERDWIDDEPERLKELKQAIKLAADEGCEWICFDRDGSICPDLEQFN